jgi:hypothetical protein
MFFMAPALAPLLLPVIVLEPVLPAVPDVEPALPVVPIPLVDPEPVAPAPRVIRALVRMKSSPRPARSATLGCRPGTSFSAFRHPATVTVLASAGRVAWLDCVGVWAPGDWDPGWLPDVPPGVCAMSTPLVAQTTTAEVSM